MLAFEVLNLYILQCSLSSLAYPKQSQSPSLSSSNSDSRNFLRIFFPCIILSKSSFSFSSKKMESVEHQNCQSNVTQFSNLHPFKLATKLLAPVCFFSVIVFSYSSLLPFLSNLMQFSSLSIDKNYVFLLCNGILVLIVKNSGLQISNSHQDATTSLRGEQNIKSGGSPQKVVEVSEITKPALVAEEKVIMEVKEVQKVVMEEKAVQEAIKDKTLVIAGDERGDHEIIVIDEDGEGDEEEVIGLLSTEELNKKCDDFIRKMRDEIKFEAQQLIMVRY